MNFASLDNKKYIELSTEASLLPGDESCKVWEESERALFKDVDLLPVSTTPAHMFFNGGNVDLSAIERNPSGLGDPCPEVGPSANAHFRVLIIRRANRNTTAAPAPAARPATTSARRTPTPMPRTAAAATARATSARGAAIAASFPPRVSNEHPSQRSMSRNCRPQVYQQQNV